MLNLDRILVNINIKSMAPSVALFIVITISAFTPALENYGGYIGRLVRYCSYAMSLCILIYSINPSDAKNYINVFPTPLSGVFAFCTLSLLWSSDLEKSAVALSITIIVAWIIFSTIKKLGYTKSVKIVKAACVIILLINSISLLLFRNISIMHINYYGWTSQWVGLMGDKNTAGAFSAVTFIIFIFDRTTGIINKYYNYSVSAWSLVFVIFTISHTAIISAVVSFTLVVVLIVSRNAIRYDVRKNIIRYAFLSLSVPMSIFVSLFCLNEQFALGIVYSSDMLSKRGELWRALIYFYFDHMWLGAGFQSFFSKQENEQGARGNWLNVVSHAHNGFIEALVQIGLPGLVLVISAFIVWPIFNILKIDQRYHLRCNIIVGLLCYCIISNITETGFLNRDSVWEVFILIAIAWVQRGREWAYRSSSLPNTKQDGRVRRRRTSNN